MLRSGEIDHEVATDQLVTPPVPVWDRPTLTACSLLYECYVRSESNAAIPEKAFCDLPQWVFLEYLVQFRDILLFGSNHPHLLRLEPILLSRNVYGWNQPRYFAFSSSMEAICRAIVDNARLKELDCSIRSTMTLPVAGVSVEERWGYYFGVDYRALPHAPWRSGTVYLYRRADFAVDFQTVPYFTNKPILSLAKLSVHPWDWPLLDQVHGVDVVAQTERQRETFRGYPWTEDAAIHPHCGRRSLVDQARAYLDANYADPVDLSQLGRRIGLSPFSLLRMFRAQVGLSPREYQTQLRITEAKRLLRDGCSIAHAAAETGFCDQTHLTRHFHRFCGITPGRYLRMQESPIHPF